MNKHDIELLLVMFRKFLNVFFWLLKRYHLVQNGRFSGQN